MMKYHSRDYITFCGRKDFADVIKATGQLTLRWGDQLRWAKPNWANTFKGLGPS